MLRTPDELEGRGPFYKLTNLRECHNGLQYAYGLNKDPMPFAPEGACQAGGMYFFAHDQIHLFVKYSCEPAWMREVTFTSDSQIWEEQDKFKTNEFVLGPRRPFELSDKQWLQAVQSMGDSLRWAPKQTRTPALCLAAVQKNGRALAHVKAQTPEICLAAVQQNGRALAHVKDQTPALQMAAVLENGCALLEVREQTFEICMAAVNREGYALQYVKAQTPEICLAAVQQNCLALRYVHEQTPALCLAAVHKYWRALCHVNEQTPELCMEAVRQHPLAECFVRDKTMIDKKRKEPE